jgi:hypothetical protein
MLLILHWPLLKAQPIWGTPFPYKLDASHDAARFRDETINSRLLIRLQVIVLPGSGTPGRSVFGRIVANRYAAAMHCHQLNRQFCTNQHLSHHHERLC